ncbi:MAG: hypothetical protein K8823_669 [Cenarchaeum symbiont of Oopsacas minuta]|nr:hypothetical protein [Cenarchaeum symbiont of Oopsacas minuta]
MNSNAKAKIAVRDGRVKLHIFEPSGRQIWTVVGKTGEYWVDKDTGYCSCDAHFFSKISNKPRCYHEESVRMAGTNVQITTLLDIQYGTFLAEMITRI